MPKSVADFFLELVQIESCPEQLKIKSREKVERSRKKLAAKHSESFDRIAFQNLYEVQDWPLVYCSLGDKARGATLKDIQSRCSLPQDEIVSILQFLIQKKYVSQEQNRYIASENALFSDGLSTSNYFRDFYLRELSRSYSAARTQFKDKNQLFYNTVLSIDSSKMEEFRNALIELLNDFVSQAEKPEGDKVVSLACSFRI